MNFSNDSRVWIYLSSRPFTVEEEEKLKTLLSQFCIQWTAHGSNLHAKGEVLHQRFIVLMVDETHAGASGCSIDKSVHFIQAIEKEFGVRLFNRMLFAWKDGGDYHISNLSELQKLFDEGRLTEASIVFDALVQTKKDFDERFQTALNKSWMMKRIKLIKEVH